MATSLAVRFRADPRPLPPIPIESRPPRVAGRKGSWRRAADRKGEAKPFWQGRKSRACQRAPGTKTNRINAWVQNTYLLHIYPK